MENFDIFEKKDCKDLGVPDYHPDPTIVFDGGDVYEGWIHRIYRLTERGLTFEAWESGGYQDSWNQEEGPATPEELKAEVLGGNLPLPRWSNRAGFEFLNKVMNGVTEEEIKTRIRQVRDALNKCKDIERIEAAARVFGL